MTGETYALGNAEVALLGLLAEKPKHPWQIEKDVEHRDMRSWSDLSTSTIYKRLRALEKAGLVASSTEVVDGRARNIYALTDAGRQALVERLTDLLSEPEHMKWRVDLATYNLDLLPLDEAVAALSAYRAKLRDAVRGYGELEAYLRTSGCPAHRQAVARRPVFLLEGEIRWVTEFIEELEAS